MLNITYEWQPLQSKPKTKPRQASRFKASWSNTQDLLDRELWHLGVRRAVIQVDAERSQFRLDGMLRADARTNSPAIAIAFHSKGRDLTFPCDTYSDWRDNLRAIALEALRKVDRYGVTSKGEQYTGWQALPPPTNGFAGAVDAWKFIADLLGTDLEPDYEASLRKAEFKTHPDHGGHPDMFKRVQAARKILCPR